MILASPLTYAPSNSSPTGSQNGLEVMRDLASNRDSIAAVQHAYLRYKQTLRLIDTSTPPLMALHFILLAFDCIFRIKDNVPFFLVLNHPFIGGLAHGIGNEAQ